MKSKQILQPSLEEDELELEGLELELSKENSPTDQDSADENQSPNIQRSPPNSNSAIKSDTRTFIKNNFQTMTEQKQNTIISQEATENQKQDDNFLVAVAGSLEGRSSRATDGDDSSLGNIGEEDEEEEESDGDYIELPALTKPRTLPPCYTDQPHEGEKNGPTLAENPECVNVEVIAEKRDVTQNRATEPGGTQKVRGRSNSLFKILGRRQKLVEEAEKKRDQEKLVDGSLGEVWIVVG